MPACRRKLLHARGVFGTGRELQDEQGISENRKEPLKNLQKQKISS